MVKLKKDWRKNWWELKNAIAGYEEYIYAFYFDEPYWTGISEEDFRFVTGEVLAKEYPHIPRMGCLAFCSMTTEGWPNIDHPIITSRYIEYLTDISFNLYEFDWNKGEEVF